MRRSCKGGICQWQDENDEGYPVGDVCGAVATHISCVPFIDSPTCEKHKCRCAKLVTAPEADRVSFEHAVSVANKRSGSWERNYYAELDVSYALRIENNQLRKALESIGQWDMINPPNTEQLADSKWLRTLVDKALEKPVVCEHEWKELGDGGMYVCTTCDDTGDMCLACELISDGETCPRCLTTKGTTRPTPWFED